MKVKSYLQTLQNLHKKSLLLKNREAKMQCLGIWMSFYIYNQLSSHYVLYPRLYFQCFWRLLSMKKFWVYKMAERIMNVCDFIKPCKSLVSCICKWIQLVDISKALLYWKHSPISISVAQTRCFTLFLHWRQIAEMPSTWLICNAQISTQMSPPYRGLPWEGHLN